MLLNNRFTHRFLRKFSLPLVYAFNVGAVALFYYFIKESREISLVFLAVVTALMLYARFIETHWLIVKKTTVHNSHITKPLRIALLTDLHVGCSKGVKWIEKVVARTIELKPDLVLIAGDLINNQFPTSDETAFLLPLAKLKQFPAYYVLGNHDYGTGSYRNFFFEDNSEQVMKRMAEIGIPLLRDELIEVSINEQKLSIFGSEDEWSKPINYTPAANAPTDVPLIFVTHNPDAIMGWPSTGRQPDLTLAGHSHGGQIALFRFPLGSASLKLGRGYYHGLREYKGKPIYISVGLGESTLPLRFGARPEISLIELKPKTTA